MKKALLVLSVLISFVVVQTSLLSCSNLFGGGSSDGSQNGQIDTGSLEGITDVFPKLGELKEIGTKPVITTVLYEYETMDQRIIDKLNAITMKCSLQTGYYETEDGEHIVLDSENYYFIEVADFWGSKRVDLHIISKGSKSTPQNIIAKMLNISWKELADIAGVEEPKTQEELLKCIEKVGKLRRTGFPPKEEDCYFLVYNSFNDKVTKFLEDKELSCIIGARQYKTKDGKNMDYDLSKANFIEITNINKTERTIRVSFFEKGTPEDQGWYGKGCFNMSWGEFKALAD